MPALFKSLKTVLLLLVLQRTFLVESKLFSSPICLQTFAADDAIDFSLTKNLITHIQLLLDLEKLSISDLFTFKENLVSSQITNLIDPNHASIDPIAEIYFDEIEKILCQKDHLDFQELLHWINKKISENNQYEEVVSKVQKQTAFLSVRTEFHPLILNDNFHSIAMSAPVTQMLWVEVMGENPSCFFDGPGSIELKVNKKWIRLKPDHPVENVTYWSAIEFANRFSVMNGVEPLYDIRNIRFEKRTRAENGTLRNLDDVHRIKYYQNICEEKGGFRLPVFEEQLINLTISKNKNFFEYKRNQPSKYAWFLENSVSQTQEVKALKPIMIQGHPFYDVEGNVAEWAFTDFSDDSWSPLSHAKGEYFSSHWKSTESELGKGYGVSKDPNSRDNKTGLRLFRTVIPRYQPKNK